MELESIYQVIYDYWVALTAVAVLVLAIAAALLYRRRTRRPTIAHALRAVSVDAMQNVLVPNGMGGQIHVEHLLLTARGLVVLDVKRFRGAVFGSDRMDEWTVISEHGRFTFPNPQAALYDRVAALRQLARDVPIAGHVLFSEHADFSKGRPKHVLLPAEFEDLYKKPPGAEMEKLIEAFASHWEKVKDSVQVAER